MLCHIFIFIFIFLSIHGACCSWIFHHCNLIILFQNGTPNVEYVAALIWNAWMSLKISAYFPLKVSQWQHWSSWKSPLTQNSISPPPKKNIAIGSRHAWRSPSLPKFPVFSTKKIFFFFLISKTNLCLSPKESHLFEKLLHPYFNSPKVIFNNAQKSFFPSPSHTRINSSYPLVDFPIKTSNY